MRHAHTARLIAAPARAAPRIASRPLAGAREHPTSSPPPARGHLCVVLHDVSPSRWGGCTRVLAELRAVAAEAGHDALPVTLLTVPMMHGVAGGSRHYLRWLHRMADVGHELALHGLTHLDDGAPPTGWAERFARRVYTAGEAEFAALGFDEASARIAQARAWAAEQGFVTPGFVAPAWILNEAAWLAVQAAGFEWTCTLDRVVALPECRTLLARSLVYSTRAAWRRKASVAWNTALAWQQRQQDAPLMRFELHPDDAEDPAVRRSWQRLLAGALAEREPLAMGQVAARLRQGLLDGTPPARAAA